MEQVKTGQIWKERCPWLDGECSRPYSTWEIGQVFTNDEGDELCELLVHSQPDHSDYDGDRQKPGTVWLEQYQTQYMKNGQWEKITD